MSSAGFLDAADWGALGFPFLPSFAFASMWARSGPRSSQFPSLQPRSSCTTRPPLTICVRPAPAIHQLCYPWGTLIRGNSHTSFSLFAVLGAGHSWSPYRVAHLPHWVKSFWRLLTPWALLLSSTGGMMRPPASGICGVVDMMNRITWTAEVLWRKKGTAWPVSEWESAPTLA